MAKGGLKAVFLAVFLLTAGVGLMLVSKARQAPAPQPRDDAEYTRAYEGLCTARSAAVDDLAGARDVFYVQAHSTLHQLADETSRKDRVLAGRLLEAKNRTERDLGGTSTESATGSLDALLLVSRQALIFLGVPTEPCG